MKIVLKRIVAYLIDIILVSLIATLLTSNSYINKDYKKYNNIYEEYTNTYEKYDKFYQELETSFKDEKLSKKEYKDLIKHDKKFIKDLKEYYEDEKLEIEEYNNTIENLNKSYSKMETDYNYKLLKHSIIPVVVNLMLILLYFVVFQFYLGGQTLGKRIMKLKVISNNDKKITILNFLLRSLIINEVFINILNIIFLILLSKNNYIGYSKIVYIITYILEMVIIFMVAFNKDNRGLHDYIANTKVVDNKKE